MEFDLESLKSRQKDSEWVTIRHPQTDEETPIRIEIASPDSEAFRKTERRIKNKTLSHVQKSGINKRQSLTIERIEENSMELLIGATLNWEGVKWGGVPMECNQENKELLYSEFPFIKEQVDEFLGDRRNFFG